MTNANSLAYKEALNEIITIQDSYMTSNTPDTAAVSLMMKWREKVLEYAVRLKADHIKYEHSEALLKAECKKKLEELASKYEAIIVDLKKTGTLKDEMTKINLKNQELMQNAANAESSAKELSAKIIARQNELAQSNEKLTSLQTRYDKLAKETNAKDENYKQSALNSEQQYTLLQQKLNVVIQSNDAVIQEKDLLYQKQISKNEDIAKSLKADIENLTNEKNSLIGKLSIGSNKISELGAVVGENGQLKSKIAEQSQINERLKVTLSGKEEAISELNSEIISYKQNKEKAIKEKEELKSKCEKEISELKKLLQKNTIEESSKYKKECDRVTKDNMKLLNLNNQLSEQIKKLKTEVSAKEAAIKKLSTSYVPERLKPSEEEIKIDRKKQESLDMKSRKSESIDKKCQKSKPKKSEELGEPFSTDCVLNDDNIENDIYKNMDFKTEVKVTDRMLNKLNHLQKLGELALEGI